MSHVLLIEPNTLLSALYTESLTKVGFSVAAVTSAQAAINATDEHTPDVIIMELQIPRHNGVEFLHELRSYTEWRHLPVIVHTALTPGNLADSEEALRQDFNVAVILYKPTTTLGTLIKAVQEQLGQPT